MSYVAVTASKGCYEGCDGPAITHPAQGIRGSNLQYVVIASKRCYEGLHGPVIADLTQSIRGPMLQKAVTAASKRSYERFHGTEITHLTQGRRRLPALNLTALSEGGNQGWNAILSHEGPF